MAKTMGAPPDYFTSEQLIAVVSCDFSVTVQNILDEVVRATLL